MWVLNEEKIATNDEFIFSRNIDVSVNKIIVECSVTGKPTWNFAGHSFITDNEIKPVSFQQQDIWFNKPQLIIINPQIIEVLSGFFILLFEPKIWVAEYGYDIRIYEWQ